MAVISTHDSIFLAAHPVCVDKIPDIPTKEIVRKASALSISTAVVLLTLFGGFWLNASSFVAILTSPERLDLLEQSIRECRERRLLLETEIQTLRNRVVDLERQLVHNTH